MADTATTPAPATWVDVRLARSVAMLLGKTGPLPEPATAIASVAQLRELAVLAERYVCDVTALAEPSAHPDVRVVDRHDWVAINASGFQAAIEPALVRRIETGKGKLRNGRMARAATGKVAALQLGAALAFGAGRVLGQYEIFSSAPGQLLLVAPNILAAETKLKVDPRDFRLWVCLHEVTHRLQFTAVPWLREYFLTELADLLDTESPLELVGTTPKRESLDRLMSLMMLMEGHAEYVMDAVGPDVIPTLPSMRRKFDARRKPTNPVQQILRKLLGIEAKMRQYVDGKRFVTAVVSDVGMAGFNEVWREADTLPTKAEFADPSLWVSRVHAS